MNRQQAPQPVVRPVRVGDSYKLVNNFVDDTWYLIESVVYGLIETNAIAVRLKNKVMQIATKSSNKDFWYCIGESADGKFDVKSIKYGSDTNVIDEDVLKDYMAIMNCESYEYVKEVPVNVGGVFEN